MKSPENTDPIDEVLATLRARRQLAEQKSAIDAALAPRTPSKLDFIRFLVSEALTHLGPNYAEVRSDILSFHGMAEMLINHAIARWLLRGASDDAKISQVRDEVLFQMPYAAKLKIIRRNGLYSKSCTATLYRLNDVRVGLAHGYPPKSDRLQYGGKSILSPGAVESVWSDMQLLFKEHSALMKRL